MYNQWWKTNFFSQKTSYFLILVWINKKTYDKFHIPSLDLFDLIKIYKPIVN